MIQIDKQKIELFSSFFRGRTDVYARRWERDGRSGYSPAYEFNWDEFKAHKRRGGSLKDFDNKKLISLTNDVIKKHLLGQHVVGIYPILPDNTSYFLAADFDGETWKKLASAASSGGHAFAALWRVNWMALSAPRRPDKLRRDDA